jgi:hypothetical protein
MESGIRAIEQQKMRRLVYLLAAFNVRGMSLDCGMSPGSILFPEYGLNGVFAAATTNSALVGDPRYIVPDPVFRCLKFIEHCLNLVVTNLNSDNIILAARIVNFANFYLQVYKSLAPFYSIDNPGSETYNTLVYGNFNRPANNPTVQQLMCSKPLFMVLQKYLRKYSQHFLSEDLYHDLLSFIREVKSYSSDKEFNNQQSEDVLKKVRAINDSLALLSRTLLSFFVAPSGEIYSVMSEAFCKSIAETLVENFTALSKAIERRTGRMREDSHARRDKVCAMIGAIPAFAKNIFSLLQSALELGIAKPAPDITGKLGKLFQLPPEKFQKSLVASSASLRDLGF